MRTKALVLTAVICAVGAATSSAQVYSVNAVGYVNKTLKKGYNLIANPLNNGGNTLAEILPVTSGLPDGTTVLMWDSAGGTVGMWDANAPLFVADAGGWLPDGSAVLPPGKAFFLQIPPEAANATYNVTFVGEVPQGPLSNPVATAGRYSLIASQVPQAGKLSTDLSFQAATFDQVISWDSTAQVYSALTYMYLGSENGGWTDGNNVGPLGEPTVQVGDGFFLLRGEAAPNAWTRTFNVNTP